MLSLKNISFGFDNHLLFNKVSFEVKEGEFCFLIGKSGCGKSSLLKLIYLDFVPISGNIEFLNFNYASVKISQIPLIRRKIGVVFQDYKLLRDRNLEDNLAFILNVTSRKKSEIRKKINEVLTTVGLSHKRLSMPDALSGGEKQRAAIARAIINDPNLIIADEPTGNLDPETSSEIIQTLVNINKRGTAVLFATHNYELIKKHNYRIFKISNETVEEVKKESFN